MLQKKKISIFKVSHIMKRLNAAFLKAHSIEIDFFPKKDKNGTEEEIKALMNESPNKINALSQPKKRTLTAKPI